MTDITAAMEACRPEIAAHYAAQVRRLFARMVADLGPDLRGVHNSWDWSRIYSGTVARYVTGPRDARSIDDARLSAGAAAYADAVIASWQDKILAKLGELENADVQQLGGAAFRIAGERNGRRVVINQQMILNVSRTGKPFNQWPATIFLDGKRVSEAAYKRAGA